MRVIVEVCIDLLFLLLLTLQFKLFLCELDWNLLDRNFAFFRLRALFAFRALNDRLLLLLLSFLALTFDDFSFALCCFSGLTTLFNWCHSSILGRFVPLSIFFLLTKSLFLCFDFLFAELIDIDVRFLVLGSGRVFVGHVHRTCSLGRG